MDRDEFEKAMKVLEPKIKQSKLNGTPEHWADLTITATLLGLAIVNSPATLDWLPKIYRAAWLPETGEEINPDRDFYFILPIELA